MKFSLEQSHSYGLPENKTKLPKIIAVVGVVLLLLAMLFVIVPVTQVVWEPKSRLLVDKTVTVSFLLGHLEPLIYFPSSPKIMRNLRIQGYVKCVSGGVFNLDIKNGKTYASAYGVAEEYFEFSVEPEELQSGLWLSVKLIAPPVTEVLIHVEAHWEERTYTHVLTGIALAGRLAFFGILLLIIALILYTTQ